MAKLLARAQNIVLDSISIDAQDFDTEKWLAQWIEIPQPMLGGRKPSELLDSPSGLDSVLKLLGAFESGAYQ